MTKYLSNCFLLLVPILIWNLFWYSSLPAAFQPELFDKDIPAFILIGENLFRIVVFGLPLTMILSVKNKSQKAGLWLYILGAIIYFCSWLILIYFPTTSWSESLLGQLAPAYTPLLWLVGIGLIGSKSYLARFNFTRIYVICSLLFLFFHTWHTYLAFSRL